MRYATAVELASALSGADVLSVRDFTSDAVRPAWPAADAMRWMHTASAGVDRVAFPEPLSSDVVLTDSRGVFDDTLLRALPPSARLVNGGVTNSSDKARGYVTDTGGNVAARTGSTS